MVCEPNVNQRLQGLAAAPGLCCGRAVVLSPNPQSATVLEGPEPVILVGQSFSSTDVLSMDREQVCGFVSATGGVTAQSGLVAGAVGLVAVLHCSDLCRIKTGDLLLVDGFRGEVMVNPAPEQWGAFQNAQAQVVVDNKKQDDCRYLAAETLDGFKLATLASVYLADDVAGAITGGAEGIGLLRSEFYYLTGDGAPSEDFLFGLYQHILASIAPLPVTIRTLDLGDEMVIQGLDMAPEANSALGLKGIRFSLRHRPLFKTQIRALYRASAFGRLRILLPMLGSCEELAEVQVVLAEVRAELVVEGVAIGEEVEVGLLVELVSTVFVAEPLASKVDFFMVGLDGLIQYGLGLDRESGAVAHLYDPLHPSIIQMLEMVICAGHGAGIPVGVCGETVGKSQYVPLFIGLGFDFMSSAVHTICGLKAMVRQSDTARCEELVSDLLHQSSASDSRVDFDEYIRKQYTDIPQLES